MSIITIDDVKYDDFESGESIGEDDDLPAKLVVKLGFAWLFSGIGCTESQ